MLDSTLKWAGPSHVVALDEVPQQRRLFVFCYKISEQSEARYLHAGGLRRAAQPFPGLQYVATRLAVSGHMVRDTG